MKKMMNWVLAATLVCGTSVLTSCKKAQTPEPVQEQQAEEVTVQKVESTELIRTSQSWDGWAGITTPS